MDYKMPLSTLDSEALWQRLSMTVKLNQTLWLLNLILQLKLSNPVDRTLAKPIDNNIGSGEKDQERIQNCRPHRHCFPAQIFSGYFMASYQGSVLSQLTQYILSSS